MINVGWNYGNKVTCPVCHLKEDDTQKHMFNCLVMKMLSIELFSALEFKYEDIFSLDLKKLISVSKICESVARKRTEIMS